MTAINEAERMNHNNMILLNDIILKIHTTEDFEKMRRGVLSALSILIPGVGNVFYMASRSEQYKLANPAGIGISDESVDIYLREFQDYDRTTWSNATPFSKIYDDSAFIQNEALHQTEFYQRIYAPQKVIYQVTLTIIHNGIFLGIITLFRTEEEGSFQENELFQLELLAAHLGARLYQNQQTLGASPENLPNLEILMNQYHLTLRETDVLYVVLNGAGKEETCTRLCISPNTLKKHIMNIYKKFNVNSRIELYHKINQL